MLLNQLGIFFLLVNVCFIEQVLGGCDYDAAVAPCFAAQRLDQDASRPHKMDLNNVVRAFQKGMARTCQDMEVFHVCVANKTTLCSGNESSKLKTLYKKLQTVRRMVCDEKLQELTDHTACIISPPVRQGYSTCQTLLESLSPSCKMMETVLKCLDDMLEKHCRQVSKTMSDITTMFLSTSFNLDNCQTQGDQKDVKGSSNQSTSHKSSSLIFILLFVLLPWL